MSELNFFQARKGKVSYLEVPPIRYIVLSGQYDPYHHPQFSNAVATLKRLDFEIHTVFKHKTGSDYPVAPMSCLWKGSVDDYQPTTEAIPDYWKLMIPQPDFITDEMIVMAQRSLDLKRPAEQARWELPQIETLYEGLVAQTLHRGSYDTEPETVSFLLQEIRMNGYRLNGKHHVIYLNSPTQTAPENLKTIIRYPVEQLQDRVDIEFLIHQLHETQGWSAQAIASYLDFPVEKTLEILASRWSK